MTTPPVDHGDQHALATQAWVNALLASLPQGAGNGDDDAQVNTALPALTGTSMGQIGDSWVQNSGTVGGYQFSRSYLSWANAGLSHRFDLTYADGVTGTDFTDANWLTTRLPALLAAKPAIVDNQAGTNGVFGGQTLAVMQIAILATLRAELAAGIRPLIKTVPPRGRIDTGGATTSGSTTLTLAVSAATDVGMFVSGAGIPEGTTITAQPTGTTVTLSAAATATASGVTITTWMGTPKTTVWGLLNAWIRRLSVALPGVLVVDIAAALTDTTASQAAVFATALHQGDGVHPGPVGAQKVGAVLASVLTFILPSLGGALALPNDPSNLLSAAATWAGGSSTVPTAWATGAFSGGTWSQVSRPDGAPGIVEQVVVPAGGGGSIHTSLPGGSWSPGDRVQAFLEIWSTGLELSPAPNTQGVDIYLQAYNSSYGNAGIVADLFNGTSGNAPPLPAAVLCTTTLVIPASGVIELDLFIDIKGGGTYKLGRVGVVKVESTY